MSYTDDPRRYYLKKALRQLESLKTVCGQWNNEHREETPGYSESWEFSERDEPLRNAVDEAIEALKTAAVWMG